LWFEITNLSDLSARLDRLLIEVWYGQPCFTGAIMKRVEIPTRSIQKDRVPSAGWRTREILDCASSSKAHRVFAGETEGE